MNDSLEVLRDEVLNRIQRCGSETELEQLRVETLGRSGKLTLLLRGLRDVAPEDRPSAGEQLNRLRQLFEEQIDLRFQQVKEQAKAKALQAEWIDITLPGTRWKRGRIHPLTLVIDEIIEVFRGMGFEIARGPDIEDDYHNFEALNMPKDHPARDMQDTAPILRRCRFAPWRAASRRSRSLSRAPSTATMMTPPIRRCSIRWKALWWIGTSLLPISKGC
jgi:phenylalanyl-tRNA synthetase alpha chain